MTPTRNQDESESSNTSTPSASKPASEDGRWLPPTLDGFPALTAVFASWSLVVSVAYDWGFFLALGTNFAQAPTTLSDHLSSWLVWATRYAPVAVAYVTHLMMNFDRQVRAAPKDDDGDDEVPSRLHLIFKCMRWTFPVLFLSWLLFGIPKNPWGWMALSWCGLVWAWLTDPRNLPEEVMIASARSAVRSISFPLLLVTWVPATFFVFFAFGYSYPDRAEDDAMPRAYVQLEAGDMDSGSVVEEPMSCGVSRTGCWFKTKIAHGWIGSRRHRLTESKFIQLFASPASSAASSAWGVEATRV